MNEKIAVSLAQDVYRKPNRPPLPSGWTLFRNCPNNTLKDGYFGAAYQFNINQDNAAIVVSHRGTANWEGQNGTIDPLTFPSHQGFMIEGWTMAQGRIPVSATGDINGDRLSDILVGLGSVPNGSTEVYISSLIYGRKTQRSIFVRDNKNDSNNHSENNLSHSPSKRTPSESKPLNFSNMAGNSLMFSINKLKNILPHFGTH